MKDRIVTLDWDLFDCLHSVIKTDHLSRKELESLMKKAVRKSDILCRFGGDEFLIITPNKDCGSNDALVSRINKYVSAWNKDYASEDYELSLSTGCAVWHKEKDLLDTVHEADRMMYEDKKRKL